jgi:hypothetical protein
MIIKPNTSTRRNKIFPNKTINLTMCKEFGSQHSFILSSELRAPRKSCDGRSLADVSVPKRRSKFRTDRRIRRGYKRLATMLHDSE